MQCVNHASDGIGDHHLFVIDFPVADMIGIYCQKVASPMSRQLNTKIIRVAADYARILEGKVLSHQLIKPMEVRIGRVNQGLWQEGISTS